MPTASGFELPFGTAPSSLQKMLAGCHRCLHVLLPRDSLQDFESVHRLKIRRWCCRLYSIHATSTSASKSKQKARWQMEQALNQLWQKWQRNGATPNAEPLVDRPGWTLRLCFRARVTALIIFLMFAGGLVGVLLLQNQNPMPQREFRFLLAGYCVLASMACYYLGFVYWYRVTLDENSLELRRLLLPTKRVEWQNVLKFEYKEPAETVTIFAANKSKVGLYLSLHGLSAVRRCLAKLVPQSEELEESWIDPDTLLMEQVPSWRCQDIELERDPFVPLEEASSISQ